MVSRTLPISAQRLRLEEYEFIQSSASLYVIYYRCRNRLVLATLTHRFATNIIQRHLLLLGAALISIGVIIYELGKSRDIAVLPAFRTQAVLGQVSYFPCRPNYKY